MLSFASLSLLRRRTATLAAVSLLTLLAACGGGGGSAGSPNTNTYNLDAAITRALQNGLQFTGLAGSLSGVAFTLSVGYAPLADAVFEGGLRRVVRETATISGGGSTSTIVDRQFFTTGPYAISGSIDDGDGSYSVLTPTGSLPTAARVGDSGAFSTGVTYSSSGKQTITSTTTMTWSLEADTATTALACLRSVINTVGSSTPVNGAQCFRITTAGDVVGAMITISEGGFSITFR